MITYLCGGINGLSDAECKDWRDLAKEQLTATLDPMRRDYRGMEASNVQEIVRFDLQDIAHCDCVLVNAERPSWGTAMEIVYAHVLGKPIYAFCSSPTPSPWLVYHCTQVLPTLAAALKAIEQEGL